MRPLPKGQMAPSRMEDGHLPKWNGTPSKRSFRVSSTYSSTNFAVRTPEPTLKSTTVRSAGSNRLNLQQIVSDKIWSALPKDFRRGPGSRSDLFRAVGALAITPAEAVAVVEEVDGADARDFFDHTGEPLCTVAEKVEEILWEVRCQNQERDTLPAPRLGAAGEE